MDTPLNLEELYDQGMAHFRAARWAEATAMLAQVREQSGGRFPEIDAILADIELKQGMERIQAPVVSNAPRSGIGRAIAGALGGVTALGLLVWGGMQLLSMPPVLELPAPPPAVAQQAVAAALPTPAPTAAPAASAPADAAPGAITVRQAAQTGSVEDIYLILDASGSMLAPVGGERKMVIARQALTDVITTLPDGSRVALRTFGRQRPDDCSDMELVSPMGTLDRQALNAQIAAITPVNLSRTPNAATLQAAALDLAGSDRPTHIVLVSDGEENCEGDPVAAAAALREQLPNVRVSVIGFDIDPAWRAQLEAIAVAGAGNYLSAGDVGQLTAALEETVTSTFRVVTMNGNQVASGRIGEAIDLPVGVYRVLIGSGAATLTQSVEVRSDMMTIVSLHSVDGSLSAEVSRDWKP
jgi:Ca-activated chloride channel homolog